jgi:hypothetical protein
VKKVLEDKERMDVIRDQHPISEEASEKEYVDLRERRIRALLAEAKVDFDDYHKYLEMNKKGVEVVLQRDIDEIYINAFNVLWLEEWNGNIDIQPVQDFFAVITYITEYAFKPEPQEAAITQALEAIKDESMENKMKMIAQSFQDNREMGEAEASYKIQPNLLMTNSNVGKQWVCLARPEERTTRARKATKEDIQGGKDVFELENVEGSWVEQWDMRSKYERRGPQFWNVSFAQFARMMVAKSKTKSDERREEVSAEEAENDVEAMEEEEEVIKEETWYASFHKVMECSHWCCTGQPKDECDAPCCEGKARKRRRLSRGAAKEAERLRQLPDMMELTNPHVGEPRHMQKRQIPTVLRFYKQNQETNPIKFFVQELILYVPYGLEQNGDMKNPLKAPDDQIVILYEKYCEHIKEVKEQVLPYLEDVTEQRFYVEKVRNELGAEEVGLQLAAGKELDNMEAMDAEVRIDLMSQFVTVLTSCLQVEENPEFAAVDPFLLEEAEEERVRISEYGRVIVPSKREMVEKSRGMDKDQRKVVDIAVKYAREIRKARSKRKAAPPPPHIMVHGSAGTGEIPLAHISHSSSKYLIWLNISHIAFLQASQQSSTWWPSGSSAPCRRPATPQTNPTS